MFDILLQLQNEYNKSLNHKTTYAVGYGSGLMFAIEHIKEYLILLGEIPNEDTNSN